LDQVKKNQAPQIIANNSPLAARVFAFRAGAGAKPLQHRIQALYFSFNGNRKRVAAGPAGAAGWLVTDALGGNRPGRIALIWLQFQ